MLRRISFTSEYNEWYLEQLHKNPHTGTWMPDLAEPPRKIRFFWRFQFKKFFIHIGKDEK